ncbi:NAD(P)-dependent oxidoreductase [Phenylobacterium sp. LjRoot219]|uniref:NAD-dependent epimerase/dehydratase family protein n=1 Tax=Phenylobacterium sp. LjRoot219 TaxID=3342283 RepID=UPI003ED155B9
MTILVTGATGQVGERLLPRLAQAGADCRALVRPGKQVPAGVTGVEGDLLDPSSLAQAVDGVSAVVHLAAVFRTQDAGLIWKSNLEGTRNLIGAVRARAPHARLIMTSTAHVYNKSSLHPGRETDVVEPDLAYPASKVAAEKKLRESGLNWTILRFPLVYGDGDGHLEMLPKHLEAFAFHPAQRISTIHHRDVATAVNLALTGAFDGRVVNISDEAPTTIYELVQLVGETMESSSEPMSNPWHLHVDASLSRSLGFHPAVRTVHQAAQEGLL